MIQNSSWNEVQLYETVLIVSGYGQVDYSRQEGVLSVLRYLNNMEIGSGTIKLEQPSGFKGG